MINITEYAKEEFMKLAKKKIAHTNDFDELLRTMADAANEGRLLKDRLDRIESTFSWLEDLGDEYEEEEEEEEGEEDA